MNLSIKEFWDKKVRLFSYPGGGAYFYNKIGGVIYVASTVAWYKWFNEGINKRFNSKILALKDSDWIYYFNAELYLEEEIFKIIKMKVFT